MTRKLFIIPDDWFNDLSLKKLVYDYLDPYEDVKWEEVQEKIKGEPKVLQYLKDNNLENMERAFDEDGVINTIF